MNNDPRRAVNHFENAEAETLEQRAEQMYSVQMKRSGQALVFNENGTIKLGQFMLTPVGLHVLPGPSSVTDWQDVGKLLARVQGALQFLIGDWLFHAERVWKKTYEEVAGAWGYEVRTLQEWVYVCKNVEISIRMEKLTFAHHQLVAPLPKNLQVEWLAYAVERRLSVAGLRKAMQKAGRLPLPPTPPSSLWGPEKQNLWKRAATWTEEAFIAARADPNQKERLNGDLDTLIDDASQVKKWLNE